MDFFNSAVDVLQTLVIALGGGGLGDLAIRYGYQRFRPEVMAIAVVVILLMVELIQFAGTFVSRRISARR